MSTEFVQVGCRLPNGLVLEVGFSVNNEGKGGAPFAMYRKGKDYKSFTLRGCNQRSIIRDSKGKPMAMAPAQIGREPIINNVPKDIWDRWIKDNAEQWVVTAGQIFVIPKGDGTQAKAAALDAGGKSPELFAPIAQDSVMKIEDHSISKVIKDE
jgi:hypothetical protein